MSSTRLTMSSERATPFYIHSDSMAMVKVLSTLSSTHRPVRRAAMEARTPFERFMRSREGRPPPKQNSNNKKTRKPVDSSRRSRQRPTPSAYAEKKRTAETCSKGVNASTKRSCKPTWATRTSSPPPNRTSSRPRHSVTRSSPCWPRTTLPHPSSLRSR